MEKKMEDNNSDRYDESGLNSEIQKQLNEHYDNASAYAQARNIQALRTEFSKIEKIVCKELDKAEKNWNSHLWQFYEKGIGEELRQFLEQGKQLKEDEYNNAEIILRFYNYAFSNLMTMAGRKDFSGDDDGCYLRVA